MRVGDIYIVKRVYGIEILQNIIERYEEKIYTQKEDIYGDGIYIKIGYI